MIVPDISLYGYRINFFRLGIIFGIFLMVFGIILRHEVVFFNLVFSLGIVVIVIITILYFIDRKYSLIP